MIHVFGPFVKTREVFDDNVENGEMYTISLCNKFRLLDKHTLNITFLSRETKYNIFYENCLEIKQHLQQMRQSNVKLTQSVRELTKDLQTLLPLSP
jgi:uncharacterized protein YlbG (UPF0298 family)